MLITAIFSSAFLMTLLNTELVTSLFNDIIFSGRFEFTPSGEVRNPDPHFAHEATHRPR